MLLGAFGLMIYVAMFIGAVRAYGWIATLLVMLGIPFLAGAWLCFVFPETAILAPLLALTGGFLVLCGGICAWNYPTAQVQRLMRRQELQADRRFIAENQRLRRH